jgi:FSR family fosmidomycin resistance protein-like MFS transporter
MLMPVVGYIADRKSMKYMLILTPGTTAVSMSLLGIAPSYFILIVLLFLAGFSSVCFHIPSPVLIKFLSGDQVGKGMSYYMTGGALAATIGTLLTSAFIVCFDIEHTYALMFFGVAASILLFTQLNNFSTTEMAEKHFEKNVATQSIVELLPFFIGLAGFTVFRAGMSLSLTLFLPLYLTGNKIPAWLAGVALSILQLSGACGMMLIGRITDKIEPKKILFALTFSSVALMWVFIILDKSMIFVIPTLIFMGTVLFASAPVILAVVQMNHSKRPALVNSIYMSMGFIINTSLVILVGFAGDRIGLDLTFKICATLPLFSLLFIPLLSHRDEK